MMRTPFGRRDREDTGGVTLNAVGNAVVLSTRDRISDEARTLAFAVRPDDENDVVVLDLQGDQPIGIWESVAGAVGRRRGSRGLRLLVCGRQRDSAELAGQWLAGRLNRPVLTPHGELIHGRAGQLFVHAADGSGWVRHQSGRAPRWDAKRFPRPAWDHASTDPVATSAAGIAEPLPAGVWIRDSRDSAELRDHWRWLIGAMPFMSERMPVVLGCPGLPPLSLDDIARFWRRLDAATRERVRFVRYGPVRIPYGETLGQALADHLGEPVVCFTGMPLGEDGAELYTITDAGGLGWRTFALELGYRPRDGDDQPAPPPRLISWRPPDLLGDVVEPRVYWYAPDAVVEIVQAGLWVRATDTPHGAEQVRAVAGSAETPAFIFDDSVRGRAERMRALAEDVIARLDPATRGRSELVPASAVVARSFARAQAGGAQDSDEATAAWRVIAAHPVRAVQPAPVPVPVADVEEPTALVIDAAVSPPADEPTTNLSRALLAPVLPSPAPADPAPVTAEIAPAAVEAVPAAVEMSPAVVGLAPAALEVSPAVVEVSPAVVEVAGPEESTDSPAPAQPLRVRRQTTPAPAAAAVLRGKSLTDERAWVRRNLSGDFDAASSSVARVLSELPGLKGADAAERAEILVDAVAVRLFLSPRGDRIDAGLRAAAKGPHVPFARCVAAGLARLPSHRGPTIVPASPSAAEWALLRDARLLTEWGFLSALVEPSADLPGDTDVLIWSMAGRRTRALEPPDGADRVVFLPGTSFLILEMREPQDGSRGRVLLRELSAEEVGADGRVGSDRAFLDELAGGSLRRRAEDWAGKEPAGRVGAAAAGRVGVLPGLVSDTGRERQ